MNTSTVPMLEGLTEKVFREAKAKLIHEFGKRVEAIELQNETAEDTAGTENEAFFLVVSVNRKNLELETNIFEEVYKIMSRYSFCPLFFVKVKDINRGKSSKECSEEWLEKAKSSLAASRLLYKKGHYADTISRAFVAMFHASRYLQFGRDCTEGTDTLNMLISLGNCTNRGQFDAHMHKNLLHAMNDKYKADYGDLPEQIAPAEAEKALVRAKDFIYEIVNLKENEQCS